MENKIGSVENADIILSGKEKEAYLEFLERGGFAEMKERAIQEIKSERDSLSYLKRDLKEYEAIKKAFDDARVESSVNITRMIKIINKLNARTLYRDREDGFRKNYEEYLGIFTELFNYLEKKDGFNKEYDLLHKNIAEEKRLMQIEYKNKIEKYKQKVRRSFWRKVFKKC